MLVSCSNPHGSFRVCWALQGGAAYHRRFYVRWRTASDGERFSDPGILRGLWEASGFERHRPRPFVAIWGERPRAVRRVVLNGSKPSSGCCHDTGL